MNAAAITLRSRQHALADAFTLPTSDGLQSNGDSAGDSKASEDGAPLGDVKAKLKLVNLYTQRNCIKTDINTLFFVPKISSTPNFLNATKKIEFKGEAKGDSFDGRIDSYIVGKEVGHGSYATVKHCTHRRKPNIDFAIKIYDKNESFNARKRRGVMHEAQILKTLGCENVVHLFETAEDSSHLYLVFEYIEGGSLSDYIRRTPGKKLAEKETRRLFRQIVSAVQYCHSKSVVHRDLKLENILLDRNGNVKVIDFGFSVVVNTVCKLNLFCGTALYLAPEIVNRKSYWGPPVDIWSLGVILYTMLSGRFPFKGNTESELYKSIARGVYINPKGVSQEAAALISSLLNADPAKRPSCSDILKDPFLRAEAENDSNIAEI
eukprot:TRINITY_DN1969_c0_g1_i12.p1 TRINITY_DN1969_c0_g1~~TRINITY_DN1969_c0_g1_i12.p1  ORF type:complete len:414 (-),score=62.89 TRINITY_DN1969_c0_g1_i12:221-1354(-)